VEKPASPASAPKEAPKEKPRSIPRSRKGRRQISNLFAEIKRGESDHEAEQGRRLSRADQGAEKVQTPWREEEKEGRYRSGERVPEDVCTARIVYDPEKNQCPSSVSTQSADLPLEPTAAQTPPKDKDRFAD